VFFAAVVLLLLRFARDLDWSAIAAVVRGYSVSTLLLAAGLAAASHGVYSCFDLIGRSQTRHGLPARQVLATAFVSYAFNLNLGALVGGVAMRYRLYSRLGLRPAVITEVLALSLLSNWLGYVLLAGWVLFALPLALPPHWPVGGAGLRVAGVAMLALAAAYVVACFATRDRVWRLRGGVFTLPAGRLALLQLALSSANWMLIAGVVFVLLAGQVEYSAVLGALLLAAVAGAAAHVPGGLGVLEAVFIAMLSHRVGQAELLGALLAYRGVYYLAPLGVALCLYLAMEARNRRAASAGRGARGRPCSPSGA
jgi:uncharacterized membrane protein YbhN (UPF0104 family)